MRAEGPLPAFLPKGGGGGGGADDEPVVGGGGVAVDEPVGGGGGAVDEPVRGGGAVDEPVGGDGGASVVGVLMMHQLGGSEVGGAGMEAAFSLKGGIVVGGAGTSRGRTLADSSLLKGDAEGGIGAGVVINPAKISFKDGDVSGGGVLGGEDLSGGDCLAAQSSRPNGVKGDATGEVTAEAGEDTEEEALEG
ncbi:hypothetical protein V6N11_028497 [Hibiscus sabdariffa]|uniref:Uncharacterized protein n=1 Tax=Hibiscus sabdariffa TaxID=183260 RepID=A0ABR1Z8A5_9ROSI